MHTVEQSLCDRATSAPEGHVDSESQGMAIVSHLSPDLHIAQGRWQTECLGGGGREQEERSSEGGRSAQGTGVVCQQGCPSPSPDSLLDRIACNAPASGLARLG